MPSSAPQAAPAADTPDAKPPKCSSLLCALGYAVAVVLVVGSLLVDDWVTVNASGLTTHQGLDQWRVGPVSVDRGDWRVPGFQCPGRVEPDDTTSRLLLCKALIFAVIGTASLACLCIALGPLCLSMPRFAYAARVLMLPAMASSVLSCVAIAFIGQTFLEWMYCGLSACDYLAQSVVPASYLSTVVATSGGLLSTTTTVGNCTVQAWTSFGLLCASAGIQVVALLGGAAGWVSALGAYDRMRRLLFLDRDAAERTMESNARHAKTLRYTASDEVKALPAPSEDDDEVISVDAGIETWDDVEALDLTVTEVVPEPPPRALQLGEPGTASGWQWVPTQQMYYSAWHRCFWNPDTDQYFDPSRAQWIDGPSGTRYQPPSGAV